jgi:hypothetical protein
MQPLSTAGTAYIDDTLNVVFDPLPDRILVNTGHLEDNFAIGLVFPRELGE